MISGKYKKVLTYIKNHSKKSEYTDIEHVFGKSLPLKENGTLYKIIEELVDEKLIEIDGGYIHAKVLISNNTSKQKSRYSPVLARITLKGESALKKSKNINWSFFIFLISLIALFFHFSNYKYQHISVKNETENQKNNDSKNDTLKSLDPNPIKTINSSVPYSISNLKSNQNIVILEPTKNLISMEKVNRNPRYAEMYNYVDDDGDGLIDEGTFPGKYISKLEIFKSNNDGMDEFKIQLEISKDAKYEWVEIQHSKDLKSFETFFNKTLKSGSAITSKNEIVLYSFSTALTSKSNNNFFRIKLLLKDRRHTYSEIVKIVNKVTPDSMRR